MSTRKMICKWGGLQAILLLLLRLTCTPALCADQAASPPVRKDPVIPMQQTRDWNAQISFVYLPTADLRGVGASVGISDYRLRIGRNVQLNSQTTLSIGGAYGLKHIEATAGAGLPQDLHSLALETGVNYRINERSFASLRLHPGLFSDFGDIGSDDVKMPVIGLGGYSFDNGLTVVGGFVYRIGYHSGAFIPVAGLSYHPDQYWSFDLIAPRPGVKYTASRQVKLFLAGDFASDEYELKDDSSGAKSLKYRDYKVMGGVEYLPLPDVKLTGAVGYAFDRSFEAFDGPIRNRRIDDVPFLKFTLDVGW